MADEEENIGHLFDTQCNAIDVELIDLVKERPSLYDLRVPQRDRTKAARDALWDEVSNDMQRKIKPLAAEIRWKYLRENYIKARKKQTLKEEMAKKTGEPLKINKLHRKYPYRYYEQMMFLNDALDYQKSVTKHNAVKSIKRPRRSKTPPVQPQEVSKAQSNLEISNVESLVETDALYDHQYEAIAIPLENEVYTNAPDLSFISSTTEVKSSSSPRMNYEQLLLNYLNKTTEKPSPIDGFLARLGEGLKRLPYRERSKLELEFLSRLNEVEDELGLLN